MNTFWKAMVILSLVLSGLALLYAYHAANPNPYSQQQKEFQQLQIDVKALKQRAEETRP